MGRLDGKVVFITGAARGQGRSHALSATEEGAAVIGVDLCAQMESVNYPMATIEDLEETAALVADRGGRMVARVADVRDRDALAAAQADGVAEFGRVDCVVANAGVMTHAVPASLNSGRAWEDSLAVILTGVWKNPAGMRSLAEGAGARRIDRDHQLLGRHPPHAVRLLRRARRVRRRQVRRRRSHAHLRTRARA